MMSFPGKGLFVPFLFLIYLFASLPPSFASAGPGADPGEEGGEGGEGRRLYLQWCSQCHGIEGRGDGINSTPDLKVNPRDHTDTLFMSTRSDENLNDVIRGGGTSVAKSSIMPPWRATLTDEEIKTLIGYLRELCNCRFEGVVSDEKLRQVAPGFR
ncbi:MAG: cytochrome c [Thermodesulfobacteriota bacterium]